MKYSKNAYGGGIKMKKSFLLVILFSMLLLILFPTAKVNAASVRDGSVELFDSETEQTEVLTPAKTADFLLYTNDRFEYSVDVPAAFTKVIRLPDNGDGLILAAEDDKSRFRASGGLSEFIEGGLKQSFDEAQGSLPVKAAYATLKKDFWVLSWLEDDEIHYRKFMLRGDTWCDFELTYPTAQKKAYDSVVKHVAESLKTR
jgi:hypothetical protein